MSSSKSRGATRKRTHILGGCVTCRRRHVKCDHARPTCATCRKTRLECGGYPSQIRWASVSCGPSGSLKGSREHRYPSQPTQQAFESQSTVHCSSEDMLLTVPEIAQPTISPNPSQRNKTSVFVAEDIPFGSCQLDIGDDDDIPTKAAIPDKATPLPYEPDMFDHLSAGFTSDLGSLFDSSNGLIWNDLFDTTFDMSMPLIHDQLPGQSYSNLPGLLPHISDQLHTHDPESQSLDYRSISSQFCEKENTDAMDMVLNPQPPPYSPKELNEVQVLQDARFLLRYFRDNIIPQFGTLPMNCRSPWETLNWSNAVQTHAELTWLENSSVKHANKANLFAIVGCSAHMVAKLPPSSTDLNSVASIHILEYVSEQAKRHMQESLRLETSGESKAKYKDQLMAIFSLIALATETGNATDARCYLIDAERLIRLRGITKHRTSRRARLLHHVYTWQRIIGESTFVIHDYKDAKLQDKIGRKIGGYSPGPAIGSPKDSQNISVSHEQLQLDNFLRIQSHGPDSDDDTEAHKDNETGLRDIHLEDARPWSNTLYMEVYGIPEIWLSYVSQTTRVANIIDYFDETSARPTRAFQECLQKKTTQLESRICSLSAQYSTSREWTPLLDTHGGSKTSVPSTASHAMMRAMTSALIILFYRRIRKVHPFILQAHVEDVIAALKDFDLACEPCAIKSPGTPWPAFIAGSEAMSKTAQDWLLDWMQVRARQSAFNGFTVSQQIMHKVWNHRDKAEKNREAPPNSLPELQTSGRERKGVYSWVDVLRESNFWPMLY